MKKFSDGLINLPVEVTSLSILSLIAGLELHRSRNVWSPNIQTLTSCPIKFFMIFNYYKPGIKGDVAFRSQVPQRLGLSAFLIRGDIFDFRNKRSSHEVIVCPTSLLKLLFDCWFFSKCSPLYLSESQSLRRTNDRPETNRNWQPSSTDINAATRVAPTDNNGDRSVASQADQRPWALSTHHSLAWLVTFSS
ncbi:hypothetical protein RRG08_008713 [Elysia crispata]|uniref:Uncharacterized protein n=1 Tax=Elysia crispata TaxID=231223 RepID=A0AAE1CJZ6_9GAST|nr:hypothetical protein RRG08_008713 [Elysia crispata]